MSVSTVSIERANYLSFIQKNFKLKVHPSPVNHGWHLVNGRGVPLKPVSPPLPQFVECDYDSEESTDSESDTDDESSESGSEYWSDTDNEIDN